MWHWSPTFRRQCARLEAAPELTVTLLPEVLPSHGGARARTVLSFEGGVLVRAEVYLKTSVDLFELIAHELEHVIEQMDGVDLRVHAPSGGAWKSGDASYETTRAIEAGRRAGLEVTTRAAADATSTPPGSALTRVRLQDRAAPLSRPTARMSANGRYVAFISSAPLVPQHVGRRRHVYTLDLETERITLETPPRADGDSLSADISGDGRLVVFASEAGNLTDAAEPPGTSQVFLKDRESGATTLVAANAGSQPASGPSWNPVISADGTTVAFESAAPDLATEAGTAHTGTSVYVKRLPTGAPLRVASKGSTTHSPALSADGRFLAFASRTHAACVETTVAVLDVDTGVITPVSRSSTAGCPDGPSYHPAISGDGRHVAFVAEASSQTRGKQLRTAQVYVHDLATGTTDLVSGSPASRPGNAPSAWPAVSFDGSRVAFQSLASNLLCDRDCRGPQRDINLLWDVFVRDRSTGRTIRASWDGNGEWTGNSRAPSLDASGHRIVFASRHPVDRNDASGDEDLLAGWIPGGPQPWSGVAQALERTYPDGAPPEP